MLPTKANGNFSLIENQRGLVTACLSRGILTQDTFQIFYFQTQPDNCRSNFFLWSVAPSPLTHASLLSFGSLFCLCALNADYCRCINILYTYLVIYLQLFIHRFVFLASSSICMVFPWFMCVVHKFTWVLLNLPLLRS